jgi:hypothetical protein
MEEIEFKDYAVTCETPGCENQMITIEIAAPAENPYFICGACGHQITDVRPAQ